MPATLPVIVLAGALGSGKTTVLNHLLAHSGGRLGVIVNDFGAVNIDAMLVAGQVDSAQSIAGGCVCCLTDTDELDTALAVLTKPSLDLDAIVIESSGLAEPRALARLILSSQVPGIRYGGVVIVTDADQWHRRGAASITATDQLTVGSLLLINKVDTCDAATVAQLADVLRAANPTAPIAKIVGGRVPPELVVDVATRPPQTGQLSLLDVLREEAAAHHHDGAGHPDSVVVSDHRGVDPTRLVQVFEHPPVGVFRLKGVTHFPGVSTRRYVAHSVAGSITVEPSAWPAGDAPSTQLVAIGVDFDTTAVRSVLAKCLTDQPVAQQSVANLTRFSPSFRQQANTYAAEVDDPAVDIEDVPEE